MVQNFGFQKQASEEPLPPLPNGVSVVEEDDMPLHHGPQPPGYPMPVRQSPPNNTGAGTLPSQETQGPNHFLPPNMQNNTGVGQPPKANEKPKKFKPPRPPLLPTHKLFSFASKFDIFLMVIALFCSILRGMSMPLLFYGLGSVVDIFTEMPTVERFDQKLYCKYANMAKSEAIRRQDWFHNFYETESEYLAAKAEHLEHNHINMTETVDIASMLTGLRSNFPNTSDTDLMTMMHIFQHIFPDNDIHFEVSTTVVLIAEQFQAYLKSREELDQFYRGDAPDSVISEGDDIDNKIPIDLKKFVGQLEMWNELFNFTDVAQLIPVASQYTAQFERIKHQSQHHEENIWTQAIYIFSIAGATFLAALIGELAWKKTSTNQSQAIRQGFMRSMLSQEIAFFDTVHVGYISQQYSENTLKVENAIKTVLPGLFNTGSTMLTGLTIAFITGWQLTLVVLLALPLVVGLAFLTTRKMIMIVHMELMSYAQAGSVAQEAIANIRTVVAFGAQLDETRLYAKHLIPAEKAAIKRVIMSGVVQGCVFLIIFWFYALGFSVGIYFIGIELPGYSIGSVLVIFLCLLIGMTSTSGIMPLIEGLFAGKAAGVPLFAMIARQSLMDPSSPSGTDPNRLKSCIEFKDVGFAYPVRPHIPIVQNINLKIEENSTVAIVGVSGSGKSTLTSLLCRLYDPSVGSILLDGVPLPELNLPRYRSMIGYVTQEPVLFDISIRDNVALGAGVDAGGRFPQQLTDHDIEQALRRANAWDFVSRFPEGLDTVVGEQGSQMSGGQKQRIAIARAIVRQPRLLLLDEATSALDTESERVVQAALETASAHCTCIIIAHRLSTIKHADKIIVLDSGRIAEYGTHAELSSHKNSIYAQMVAAQSSAQEMEEVDRKNDLLQTQAKKIVDDVVLGGLGLSHADDEEDMMDRVGKERMAETLESARKAISSGLTTGDTLEEGDVGEGIVSVATQTLRQSLRRRRSSRNSKRSRRDRSTQAREMADVAVGRSECGDDLDVEIAGDQPKKLSKAEQKAVKKMKAFDDEEEELINAYYKKGRIWRYSRKEWHIILFGCIAAAINGAIFPAFAVMYVKMLTNFMSTDPCEEISNQAQKGLHTSLVFLVVGVLAFFANFGQISLFGIAASKLTSRLRLIGFRAMMSQTKHCIHTDGRTFSKKELAQHLRVSKDAGVRNYLKRYHCEALGVSRDANVDEIDSAFKKLVQKYDSDATKDAKWEEKFKEVIAAYAYLKDIEFFDDPDNSSGALCSRLVSDVSSIHAASSTQLAVLIKLVSAFSVALTVSLYYSWRLTLVFACFIPFAVVSMLLQIFSEGDFLAERKVGAKIGKILVELMGNIRTITALHMQYTMLGRMNNVGSGAGLCVQRARFFGHGLAVAITSSLFLFGFGTMFYFGTKWNLPFEEMYTPFAAIMLTLTTMGEASSAGPAAHKASLAAAKLLKLIDSRPTIENPDRIEDQNDPSNRPVEISGHTSVQAIEFRYPIRPEARVIEDISFEVPRGGKVGIVGPSGCGKSTLTQLILRYYDPLSGRICFDSRDLKTISGGLPLKTARDNIGIVSQEPILFDRTIRDNIAYGLGADVMKIGQFLPSHKTVNGTVQLDPKKFASAEEYQWALQGQIEEAAKQANIHNFIDSLPNRYLTRVGERGTQLSGGQKQRIAIARALIRQPKLLILDEATSALDSKGEKVVRKTLSGASVGRTTLTIAHRLNTIAQDCSNIVVLGEDGKIKEMGTHDHLMESGKLYAALWKAQSLHN